MSARAGALVAALPLLLGGVLPAEAATASHVFTPAMGDHVRYQFLGAAMEADATPPQVKFSCQIRNRNPMFPTPFCYGPDQVRVAYEVQPLLDAHIDGSGRTIVIVDAFQSPTIRGDLAAFDTRWGYPDPPSFDIVAPDGLTTFDITSDAQVQWSMEISLDVEWAHVMAPRAAIVLVLAKSDDDEDMLNALQYAVDRNLGDAISMSFGEAETCAGPLAAREHDIFRAADAKGITLFAAAGDFGAAQHACGALSYVSSASSPASDPLVTAVGGTQLMADARSGAYQSETAWNNPRSEPELGATGGGFSSLYRRPGYQAPFQADNTRRGVPDVAFAADMRGGLLTAWSVLCGMPFNCAPTGGVGYFGIGGTSAGSPQWAAFAVLADQVAGHRVGSINKELYHIAKSADYGDAFHDVTAGDNAFGGVDGFSAGPGWDAATGLGTPRVAGLVPMLAKTAPSNN